MNIIIIEDELKAAKSLISAINHIRPAAKILTHLQSVERAVNYLNTHEAPDLVFMDIQLSDGLCFEIFKSVKVQCPVVFCTAYGEYAMDAIKANGVDYVLKPFVEDDILYAFEKVEKFKNFFQQHAPFSNVDELLSKIGGTEGKKSFLVFKHNKYLTIATETIAFFYIRNEIATIMTFSQEEYALVPSLDQIHGQLSSSQFYRLNRQYLVNFAAIKEVEHYFSRKLFVRLSIPAPDKLLVTKEKASSFLHWLENR